MALVHCPFTEDIRGGGLSRREGACTVGTGGVAASAPLSLPAGEQCRHCRQNPVPQLSQSRGPCMLGPATSGGNTLLFWLCYKP